MLQLYPFTSSFLLFDVLVVEVLLEELLEEELLDSNSFNSSTITASLELELDCDGGGGGGGAFFISFFTVANADCAAERSPESRALPSASMSWSICEDPCVLEVLLVFPVCS